MRKTWVRDNDRQPPLNGWKLVVALVVVACVIIAALYKGISPKDVAIVTAPLLVVIGVINFPFRLITLRLLPTTDAPLGFALQPGEDLASAADDLDPVTAILEEIEPAPEKRKPKKPAAKKIAKKLESRSHR